MKIINKLHRSGDTMVEVMLSMAVIGLVIGGAYTISNKSTQLGRLAQQRTQVNNLMRSQAELIKLFRDGKTTQWQDASTGDYKDIKSFISSSLVAPTASILCTSKINSYASPIKSAFYIDASQNVKEYKANPDGSPSTSTDSGVDSTGQYQIFTVPYQSSGTFTDFYIIGCWQGPGSYGEQQSFIVERLNNPS